MHKQNIIIIIVKCKKKRYNVGRVSNNGQNPFLYHWEVKMYKNKKVYPLTHPQMSIWNTEKMYPNTSIGNIAATLRIKGDINISLMKKAIHKVIKNNDGIRLHIVEKDGLPMQYISEFRDSEIDVIDFSKNDNIQDLFKWEEEQSKIPFKLIDADLFEFTIIKVNDQEAGFYLKTHHLISDAWTMSMIGNLLVKHYTAFKDGEEFEEKQTTYIDYIVSEQKYKESNRFKNDKKYWHEVFESIPEMTTLKVRKSKEMNTKTKRKTLVTPEKFTKKLRQYCMENKISPYPLFLSALAMYIKRVSSKDDIIFGTPILNRSNRKEKNTVGMFISTAPLRIHIDENKDFRTFSQEVSKECVSLLRHQKYPYDLMLKEIREKHGMTDNLYDIVLSYQNAKLNKEQLEKIQTRWHFNGYQTNSLTIHINDRDDEGRLIIDYDFRSDLFYVKEIEFIHSHIISLLWHALDNPIRPIKNIEMLTEKEKHKILYEFNKTEAEYPKDKTIHQLFEEQVRRSPDNIALVFEDQEMTYQELNEKANGLARTLRNKGVKQDDIIGIMVPRSFEMMIGILGILKAGGAYLPIDPEYPEDRILYMLEDSNAKILLTSKDVIIADQINEIMIDLYDDEVYSDETSDLENVNTPNDLIYVIYTSGSTGKPKGVMIEQRGVVNYIIWANKVYVRGDKITFPLYSSYAFDLTVTSMFTPLISGNRIIIYNEDNEEILIRKIFKENKVDIVKLTPTHLQLIKDMDNSNSKIKRLILGGEDLKAALANEIVNGFNGNVEIYNEYGPTETVVGCMIYKYDADKDIKVSVPIGTPADNVKIYILDKNINLVPIGIPGEIYISGDGIARGYINRNKLTEERFIDSPFENGKKIYKTGDLARWYAKGDIEYLGRSDYQVKIRGFRIELGEIEEQLSKHEAIEKAVIIDKNYKDGKKYLCAYVVSCKELIVSDLRRFLSQKLPNYMIPARYINIEKIPMTHNGKVDREKLVEIDGEPISNNYVAPTNEIERKLVKTCSKLFEHNNIGINDNFFDLGCDSLLAIQLQVNLLKHNWNITTQEIYRYTTIHELAKRIIGIEEKENKFTTLEKKVKLKDDNSEKRRNDCLNTSIVSMHNIDYKNVLLIGSTGYLGIHILDDLLTNTDVNIYCIVRGKGNCDAEKRLKETLEFYFEGKYNSIINKRVFIINGDITSQKFGIGVEEYLQLGEKIDGIIHTGALVKYYGDYHDFEKVNVFGTERVMKFSLKFNKPVFYVSTIGLSGQYLVTHKYKNSTFSEKDLYIGQNYMENVYVRSKYEAERLINKYIDLGLKVAIIRVGNLTGRYTDGHFQKNITHNSFYNIIKSIMLLGAVSENILNESFDFTPVDYCSKATVRLFLKKESIGRTFHLFNHKKINVSRMLELFKKIGINIKSLDKDEFQALIKSVSTDESNKDKLKGIINDINTESQLSFSSSVIVESKLTIEYLKQLDFEWPEMNEQYLEKIISYMKDVEYISQK